MRSYKNIGTTYTYMKYFLIGSDLTPKSSTRKRQKNPEMWKQHLRKRLRESGREYMNIKGTNIKERKVMEPCKHTCFHLCTKIFSPEVRQSTFNSFWSLSDIEKPTFYCKFVKQVPIKRRRKIESSKKTQTFHFYLETDNIIHQVCKIFF